MMRMIRSIKERLLDRKDTKYLTNEINDKKFMKDFEKTIELTASGRIYRKCDDTWLKTDEDLVDHLYCSMINHVKIDVKYKNLIRNSKNKQSIHLIPQGGSYFLGYGVIFYSDRDTDQIEIGGVGYGKVEKDRLWFGDTNALFQQIDDNIGRDEEVTVELIVDE